MPSSEGARMQILLRGVLIVAAVLLLVPAGARAAAAPAVTGLSAPGSVAAEGRLDVTVKVRNAARKKTKPAKLRVLLSADRKLDGRDTALAGTVRVPALPARRSKTVKATLTVPATVKPGR